MAYALGERNQGNHGSEYQDKGFPRNFPLPEIINSR